MYIFFLNKDIFHDLKLEIALAIPGSFMKIEKNNLANKSRWVL